MEELRDTTWSARKEAVYHLMRIEEEGAFVGRMSTELEDPRDVRFLSDLVSGVTRLRRLLDFLIASYYHGDINKLDDSVRQILRIGLYELFERGTPSHAAVSEAVATTKQVRGKGASGLVNAILRAALRAREAGEVPVPDSGRPPRDLGVQYSHPTWMVRRWLARYGEEATRALLERNNARPSHGLRINTSKIGLDEYTERLTELGVDWTLSRFLDDFVVVEQLQPIIRSGFLDEGLCAVQDEAAGLVVRVLDPQPGDSIWDCAAAPGGKALYAAQRMQNEGQVVASDIHESRTELVSAAAANHGFDIVETMAADLRTASFEQQFDKVLLDAPCSGLGVLAKRADLRWQASPEKVAELVALQRELIEAASRHVKPGGLLVYSTCSIEPDENERQVANFLQFNPSFVFEPVGETVPESMSTADGFYAALPYIHQTDGAFAARLRKSL